jgi:hypothetical protein
VYEQIDQATEGRASLFGELCRIKNGKSLFLTKGIDIPNTVTMEELIINISDITLETTLFHLTFASYLA